VVPLTVPSESGPPRCGQRSSMATKFPFRLKIAIARPPAAKSLAVPAGISSTRPTLSILFAQRADDCLRPDERRAAGETLAEESGDAIRRGALARDPRHHLFPPGSRLRSGSGDHGAGEEGPADRLEDRLELLGGAAGEERDLHRPIEKGEERDEHL